MTFIQPDKSNTPKLRSVCDILSSRESVTMETWDRERVWMWGLAASRVITLPGVSLKFDRKFKIFCKGLTLRRTNFAKELILREICFNCGPPIAGNVLAARMSRIWSLSHFSLSVLGL